MRGGRGLGGVGDEDQLRKFPTLFLSTADFIKKVLGVYTHSKATIYLSLSAQVAESTFFMKSPVYDLFNKY